MKIGLISDTHGFLDEGVYQAFKDVDEIWHAGDIGSMDVLQKLEVYKPTKAVYGNIDDHRVRIATQEYLIDQVAGVKVLMIHIAGKPLSYSPQVKKLILANQPNLLICGHSHILQVINDPKNKLLFMNPGAAGKHGLHKIKTVLRFELTAGKIQQLEMIELGLRGKLTE